ncbi:Pleckstrin homology domain-containing protein [Suillus occidentalis]|nr:Pleckstrin homology domain-containing protein [Suillus occidentalis]
MKQPPASPSSARSPRNQLIGHPTLDLHHSHHHHLSPTSNYQLPTNSPKPTKSSAFKGLQSVFQRKPPDRSLSSNSLRSSYSASNASATDTHSPHPYAAMPPAPLPVVSTNEHIDDEQECPVCLEPLSFSFRLPGEKPHVVPECGHSLHEACFTAVYGPPPAQSRSAVPRKSNLGVCGVCRRPMKIGDGDGSKNNKLAALTGMGNPHAPAVYPGRDQGSRSRHSPVSQQPYDPTDDDPIDHAVSVKSTPSESHYIVAPSIQVRPEFSSITRNGETYQPLTCIVVIELPARRGATHVPGPIMGDAYSSRSAHTLTRSDTVTELPHPSQRQNDTMRHPSQNQRYDSRTEPWSSTDEAEASRFRPGPPAEEEGEESSPFNAIVEDLRNRIIDWKGHALSGLGPLQMYDMLSVRRDALVREFFVYLFKEAIICVVEEKKRSLGRFLSSPAFNDAPTSVSGSSNQSNKGVLRLKGRIYVRHIKRITASTSGEMSLTIEMEDERLDSFILVFKDRSSMDAWKSQIQGLVNSFQNQASPPQPPIDRGLDMDEFGGSGKAARMLSGSTASTSPSTVDSLLQGSSRSTMSSLTSHGSVPQPHSRQMHSKLQPLGEDDVLSHYETHPSGLVAPHVSAGPSNSLAPLPHPALDLILIVSLPPPSAPRSTAALKLRVIKTSLDFILASLGTKDRLSLVTFEVGPGGRVRKTPYLCVGKALSRGRLSKFIDEIGRLDEGQDDEFLVRASKEEKTDVVTAVNHGLDVVLQRKSRNPISGMVLVSDAADSTRRAQMDLVLARAEAANMPIHSFGYGRSHDPASLWLMSNHTSGTYTFVKDWYDLRSCLAGCVGGMMSIGLLNMKLHMKIVDGQRFRIRKVSGGPSSILSTDGHNVDIDVGELRYGECKEMLIECELDNTEVRRPAQNGNRALNATDQFVQSMGLDSMTIDDGADLVDGMMDRMIDEVPVFEVDGSFYDPSASKQLALPRPSQSNHQIPVIVRRRMELLASDMITRALVLVSRKNYPQAQKIMNETKRILHTVLQSISKTLPPPNAEGTMMRNRKDILTLAAVRAMQAILQDLQILVEALEENVELFAH